MVAAGYDERDEIVEELIDSAQGDELDVTEEQIAAIVDEAWREHLAEQATWPPMTDVDRLNRAFATLDASGIVARQNFSCCQNCGHGEIRDERPDDAPSHGYTFFHVQDTEAAVDGGGLYLAYGSFEPDSDAAGVGRRVSEALRAEGLSVEWNGSTNTRILVKLEWRRRLPVG